MQGVGFRYHSTPTYKSLVVYYLQIRALFFTPRQSEYLGTQSIIFLPLEDFIFLEDICV